MQYDLTDIIPLHKDHPGLFLNIDFFTQVRPVSSRIDIFISTHEGWISLQNVCVFKLFMFCKFNLTIELPRRSSSVCFFSYYLLYSFQIDVTIWVNVYTTWDILVGIIFLSLLCSKHASTKSCLIIIGVSCRLPSCAQTKWSGKCLCMQSATSLSIFTVHLTVSGWQSLQKCRAVAESHRETEPVSPILRPSSDFLWWMPLLSAWPVRLATSRLCMFLFNFFPIQHQAFSQTLDYVCASRTGKLDADLVKILNWIAQVILPWIKSGPQIGHSFLLRLGSEASNSELQPWSKLLKGYKGVGMWRGGVAATLRGTFFLRFAELILE